MFLDQFNLLRLLYNPSQRPLFVYDSLFIYFISLFIFTLVKRVKALVVKIDICDFEHNYQSVDDKANKFNNITYRESD